MRSLAVKEAGKRYTFNHYFKLGRFSKRAWINYSLALRISEKYSVVSFHDKTSSLGCVSYSLASNTKNGSASNAPSQAYFLF